MYFGKFAIIFKIFFNSCVIGKATYREKDTKCYGDGLSSMMTPPLAITLSHWFFSLFFPLQFSGEKLHCPERSFVTMWFARPYLTFLNAAIAYPSSLTSLFSFFHGSTRLLIPFILPRLISFCPSTKYCTLWDCFLPKNNCCLPLSDSTWILVLG